MYIGLVYDLRDAYRDLGLDEEALAEFDQPETIDALEAALQADGHQTERIGSVRALAQALVAGQRWELVFNIAEGLRGRSREAQVPALLEAYEIPYLFSDPLTMALTLDKGMCKRLVRGAGLPTAAFFVLNRVEDLSACTMSFPLFIKPVAEGSGKGCDLASKVDNPAALAEGFERLRHRFSQPVLVEPYLPGREFTVAIVGNGADIRLHCVAEINFQQPVEHAIYTFANKEASKERVIYQLVEDAEAQMALGTAMAIYQLLGCRDAGRLDFRVDADGIPQFLEINPLAGLHPVLSGLPMMAGLKGWSYHRLIQTMVGVGVARLSGG